MSNAEASFKSNIFKVPSGSVWAAAVALILCGYFGFGCWRSLRTDAPTWVDGPILGFMQAFRDGRIYQSSGLQTMPYTVLTHTPLSYWIGYLLYRLWPGYWILRLLNIAVSLGCAALIFVWVRRRSPNPAASLFAACAFLLTPAVFRWSQVTRSPDSFCCFFSLAAFLAAEGQGRHRRVAVGCLVALAVLSKQTAVLTLAPALLAFDWLRKDRRFWQWIAVTAAILVPFFLIMQVVTEGGFWTNVFTANLARHSRVQFEAVVIHLILFWPFLALVWFLSRTPNTIAHIWCAVCFAVGIMTCAKLGSDTMYFFDCSAAAAMLAGLALARAKTAAPAVTLTCCLVALTGIQDKIILRSTRPAVGEEFEQMLAYVRPYPAVLSEEASVPIKLGQQWYWDDPFVLGELSLRSKWDPSPIIRRIESRSFGAIIVRNSKIWPQEVYSAVAKHYRVARSFQAFAGEFFVYLPVAPTDQAYHSQ